MIVRCPWCHCQVIDSHDCPERRAALAADMAQNAAARAGHQAAETVTGILNETTAASGQRDEASDDR